MSVTNTLVNVFEQRIWKQHLVYNNTKTFFYFILMNLLGILPWFWYIFLVVCFSQVTSFSSKLSHELGHFPIRLRNVLFGSGNESVVPYCPGLSFLSHISRYANDWMDPPPSSPLLQPFFSVSKMVLAADWGPASSVNQIRSMAFRVRSHREINHPICVLGFHTCTVSGLNYSLASLGLGWAGMCGMWVYLNNSSSLTRETERERVYFSLSN